MKPLIGMCFGTFNRLPMLTDCIASIRRAAGDLAPRISVHWYSFRRIEPWTFSLRFFTSTTPFNT